MPMTTRPLGRTSLRISPLGLGAWAMGGGEWQGGWGRQDDDASVRAVHRAVEHGVNWVDTAPAYGFGRSEEVVGRAVEELPEADRPLIFTKCGLVWEREHTGFSNVLAPASVRAECEASLRRLRVDAIDLYQVHWPSEDGTPVEDAWATMAALVDEGKVRYIGVSNFGVDLLERCQAVRQVDSFQPQLNMLVREAAGSTLPWCRANGTGVIVYSPMASGLLTGRFSAERAAALPGDDWRKGHPDFSGEGLGRNLDLVERLRPIAGELGCTLPELAVAWALAWPGVDGAIVGARGAEQVDGWVGAASVDLGASQLDAVAEALEASGAGGAGPTRPSDAVPSPDRGV